MPVLDADDERDDLNEAVLLELPVDVFEAVIDDVCVRVRRPLYDDRIETEFDDELLEVFDLAGEYDIGNLALEYLSLSLPTNPKLAGESADHIEFDENEKEIVASPFATLMDKLKDK